MSLAGAATLVTGGAGFLGRRVMRALAARDGEAVCFDRRELAGAACAVGDVMDPESLEAAIVRYGARRIIHLAAVLPPETETQPGPAARLNVIGTRNVLEAAVRHGIERVVYASSIAVYGPQSVYGEDTVVGEDDTPCPTTGYGMAKAVNEAAALAFGRRFGVDTRILRISSVFGHGREKGVSGEMCGVLISRPAVGLPVEIAAGPDEASSLIYVDDAAELCARLALAAGSLAHPVYNSGGMTATVREIAAMVKRHVPDARITTGLARIAHVHRVDGERVARDTGYKLPPLEQRIADQIAEARREAAVRVEARGGVG